MYFVNRKVTGSVVAPVPQRVEGEAAQEP